MFDWYWIQVNSSNAYEKYYILICSILNGAWRDAVHFSWFHFTWNSFYWSMDQRCSWRKMNETVYSNFLLTWRETNGCLGKKSLGESRLLHTSTVFHWVSIMARDWSNQNDATWGSYASSRWLSSYRLLSHTWLLQHWKSGQYVARISADSLSNPLEPLLSEHTVSPRSVAHFPSSSSHRDWRVVERYWAAVM